MVWVVVWDQRVEETGLEAAVQGMPVAHVVGQPPVWACDSTSASALSLKHYLGQKACSCASYSACSELFVRWARQLSQMGEWDVCL